MKTINVTDEEQAELLKLRARKTAKATSTESSDVVRAADEPVQAAWSEAARKSAAEARRAGISKGSSHNISLFNAGNNRNEEARVTVSDVSKGYDSSTGSLDTHVHFEHKGKQHKMPISRFRSKITSAEVALDDEAVRAAGTSEGAKKGWNLRGRAFSFGHAAHAATEEAFADSESPRRAHTDAALAHRKAAEAHRAVVDTGEHDGNAKSIHSVQIKHHQEMEKEHNLIADSRTFGGSSAKASDTTNTEVVHCRSHSASGPVLAADNPWSPGEQVEFMWMPAGTSTICAGFRKGSIELTVNCDENTAAAVQASLESWREERPKQEPFGCIEHKEQEASFRVGASCGFKWNDDGVYLAAEPTTLGAQNVNGRVHRSWSPSFTTDADYSKATERNGVLMFPDGARGSRSNPARITGVDFCVGTLTNKPAFHSMNPVKAREVVQAGTSEGVRKAWVTRRDHRTGGDVHESFMHESEYKGFEKEHELKWRGPHAGHEGAYSVHTDKAGRKVRTAIAGGGTPGERIFHVEVHGGDSPVKAKEAATVTAAGTSEGVKKGWEHRDHIGMADNHYGSMTSATDRFAMSGRAHELSDKALKSGLVGDHFWAAKAHKAAAKSHGSGPENAKHTDIHKEGYKHHREKALAWQGGTMGGGISKNELKENIWASESITAHCAETLKQDVPDATPAEVACYEKCLEDGGSHTKAVEEIRKQRNPAAKASEPMTPDTILARQASALEQANAIATEHGVARTTLDDVYSKCAVQATWSPEARAAALASRKAHSSSGVAIESGKKEDHGTAAIHHLEAAEHYWADDDQHPDGAAHSKMASRHMSKAGFSSKEVKDSESENPQAIIAAIKKRNKNNFKTSENKEAYKPGKPKDNFKATDATPGDILNKIYASSGHSTNVVKAHCGKLLGLLGSLRAAHWNAPTQTNDHEALGELYETLDGLVDEYVESSMGKKPEKVTPESCDCDPNDPAAVLDAGERIVTGMRGDREDLNNLVADMEKAINKTRYLLKAGAAGGPIQTSDKSVDDILNSIYARAGETA